MGPGGGVPAAPSRLPVPLLLLFLLLLAPCMSFIRADDSSAASNTPSATPPWSPSTAATNASGNTAANDVDNSLETASPSSSRSPHAHEDPGVPGPRGSTGSTNVTENTGGGGPGGAAHQTWKCPVAPTEEPPGTPKTLLVAYLSNVGGTDNLRRQGLVVSGAMTYAIELINRNRTIPGYQMAMVYRDTRGEMLHGTRAVVECRDMGAKAFFGPEDSCYVEAALAASLNLPMISYKCSDANVANYENTTFARTVPSAALVVRSVTALLSFYDWRKFSIVQENSLGYETMAQSLESRIKGEKRFTINSKNVFNSDLSCCEQKLPCCQTAMTKILDETYRKTRIYVFLGNYRDLQTLLIAMRMRGLTDKAEYLVIMIDHDIDSWEEFNHNFFGKVPEKDIRALSEACSQLLVILPRPPAGDSYSEFIEKVREYNQKPPFNFPPGPTIFKKHITQYASYLFDSVMLYADAVTSLIRKNHNISDGQAVIREIIGRKRYKSVTTAEMSITPKGDVEGNYTVLAFLPVSDEAAIKVRNKLVEARRASHSVIERLFQPAGGFKYVDDETAAFDPRVNDSLLWKTGQPPLAEPPCGYDGSGCNAPVDNRREILASVLGVLLILVSVFATIVYRNWKYEQEIAGLLWMIDKRELEPLTTLTGPKHGISKLSLISQMVSDSRMMNLSEDTYRYRGTMTYVKKLVYHRRSADIPRAVKKEMKLMRELHHENLNPFVGACVEPNCIYAVSELCVKGNLQDILENDVIKLDNMFIASFVFDIIKGLRYLHESDLRVHGNLRSTNVLVTNLWVLRLTNFGLLELRATNAAARANRDDKEDYQLYRSQLWRSPEVLRNPSHYPRGSQKDDMYAFAIILHEIIGRQGPWGSTRLEPKAIIDKVKAGGDPPFRPPVSDLQCQDYVLSVISDCWAEKPDARPELSQVQERLKKMRQGMKPNIMDNLMALMEKYANNLEELVTERTCLLEEEKKKTEALLHRMLPKTVALQLMRGQMVVPESFDAVTIYFSDIVGFTEMSATSTPLEVVNFLNELYTCFDSIIRHYDVYKVETIGDAYMVVSGLPERNGDAHAREVASMALEILDAVRHFTIRHRPGATLKLRIGIHSGPVVAGVVGLTMPRYCLFGDTVNTASRMESNGEALKIHISSQCRDLLVKIGGYDIADRGLVKMKGKGELRTYWLLGHKAGPQHRRAEDGNQFLPAPLFNVGDGGTGGGAMAAPHRSPKTEGLPRRGSLIPKLSDHDTDLLGTALMNGSVMGGIQALHRLKQDSPGILRPKPSRESSFTHKGPRRHEFLEAPSSRTNSVADLDGGLILPRRNESTLSPCAKDEFGCSNPDLAVLRARQWAADRGKNGLKSLDESARPLLRDASTNCNGNGGGHLLSLAEDAAKRWRSCDEIAALAPTRDKLKKVFTGLLRAGASRDKSRDWDSTAVDAGGGLPRLVCESAEDTTESIV
ncbi:receptor-type guanylate cyclase Gyc76C [Rhipicephalus sanguineus]|uniref:receptor-type guanylate cyclase Gyc76C n=1 Tax=Rhipicephalus sanguineus TaxID=34632 RepID=UPI001895C201|nr:receptor-type guanylate cyclase Gyc76C [Rhipicephalus sanguineus]XP_049273870.1 receptor-type guanylate cyclase Gyc76C [Rhipicephalus sanguineus]